MTPEQRKQKQREYSREYKKTHRTQIAANNKKYTVQGMQRRARWRRLGLDMVKAQIMWDAHDGICDMPGCGATEPGGSGVWNLDHDHQTLELRGILCFPCNVSLSKFGDTLDSFEKGVMVYLRSGKEPILHAVG